MIPFYNFVCLQCHVKNERVGGTKVNAGDIVVLTSHRENDILTCGDCDIVYQHQGPLLFGKKMAEHLMQVHEIKKVFHQIVGTPYVVCYTGGYEFCQRDLEYMTNIVLLTTDVRVVKLHVTGQLS